MTTAVVKVLVSFLEDPVADRYGLDLMRVTSLPSGTLYPILERLEQAGWVESAWETIDPAAEGRPARRNYRLTTDGLEHARAEVAALRQQLSKVDPLPGKLRSV